MQTAIFMALGFGLSASGVAVQPTGVSCRRPKAESREPKVLPFVISPEKQCGIRAAKAERVRQGMADRHLAARMRHVIQVASLIGTVEVYGRRHGLMMHGQHRN